MSGSVNKVIIVGNICQDIDVRNFQNGGKVVNLSVATNENWKDKNSGEKRQRTEYHRVAIFSEGIVRVAEQYLKKGSKVYIEGQLETRKWQDQQGLDKYSTEVVLRPYTSTLTMLDGPNSDRNGSSGGGHQSGSSGGGYGGQGGGYGQSQGGGYSGGAGGGDLDDDVPFDCVRWV